MSTSGNPAQAAADRDHRDVVRTVARAFERDRYLASLLAPLDRRTDLLALAAFAGELERIRVSVSTPLLGEIRLQWWRDTLDAGLPANSTPTGHPVADAWLSAMRRHGIPAATVQSAIDAQIPRLGDRPFTDVTDVSANVVEWDGALFHLAWRILGGSGAPPAVIETAGEAYGLTRLLIETPAEMAQGRMLLPSAYTHIETDQTRSTVWHSARALVSQHIHDLLDRLATSYPAADHRARLAALPIALLRPYLRLSERLDMAADEPSDISPLTRAWRLWLTSLTGRI